MKIGFYIGLAILLTSFLMLTSFAQDSKVKGKDVFEMKLDNTISFREKLNRIYNRESYRHGNIALSPASGYSLGSINNSTVYVEDLNSGEIKKISVFIYYV